MSIDTETTAAAENFLTGMGMSLEELLAIPDSQGPLLDEAIAWANETFPAATPASIAKHLRREAAELAANPTDASELADVMLLCAHLADKTGVLLARVVREKLAVNRARTWGNPDADGIVEHVREEEA